MGRGREGKRAGVGEGGWGEGREPPSLYFTNRTLILLNILLKKFATYL